MPERAAANGLVQRAAVYVVEGRRHGGGGDGPDARGGSRTEQMGPMEQKEQMEQIGQTGQMVVVVVGEQEHGQTHRIEAKEAAAREEQKQKELRRRT